MALNNVIKDDLIRMSTIYKQHTINQVLMEKI